jgi:hypothetical protein
LWAKPYGLKLTPEREAEVQLRTMEKRLARTLELDPRLRVGGEIQSYLDGGMQTIVL